VERNSSNWDRDLFGITAAQVNGTSTLQTYDFLEFRTWRAIPPALALSLVAGLLDLFGRERRRRARGVFLGCGYDLRATPDRCPECGRPCA
jgi:hypothetical protein